MKTHTILVVLSVLTGAMLLLNTECSSSPAGGGKMPISGTVLLYTGEATGGSIGPAIRDAILADTAVVAAVSSLDANQKYSYVLGDQSGVLEADGEGKLGITKGHLAKTNAKDGDKLILNKEGSDASTEKVLAIYHPGQLYIWQDVQAMRLDVAGNYKVMKDIAFPALGADGFPETGFAPIGTEENKFAGSLDGNGKTIRGLAIQGTANYVGLFGSIEGAAKDTEVVKNLTLHNASVVGNNYVGALAGRLHKGTVSNVAVTVDEAERESKKVKGNSSIGGLIGSVEADGVVYGQSHIFVEGIGGRVGGLVAYNTGTVVGYATGTVSGSGDSGGFVGYNTGTVVGYATGAVLGLSDSVGGLVGANDGTGTATGYAIGSITMTGGYSYVGGFAGNNNGIVIGYARGQLRSGGATTNFGEVLGFGTLGSGGAAYYSNRRGSSTIVNANGSAYTGTRTTVGTGLTVDASTTQAAFKNLSFGAAIGQWTWVGNGKWPALNLGPNVGKGAAASEQPTAPSTAATQ